MLNLRFDLSVEKLLKLTSSDQPDPTSAMASEPPKKGAANRRGTLGTTITQVSGTGLASSVRITAEK